MVVSRGYNGGQFEFETRQSEANLGNYAELYLLCPGWDKIRGFAFLQVLGPSRWLTDRSERSWEIGFHGVDTL